MRSAAREGHKSLVKFFIEKGADNYDEGMIYAVKGGHKFLVDFLKKKKIQNIIEELKINYLCKN